MTAGGTRDKLVEPRMRRLVAEQLGVDEQELTPEVSLTDDLAADSLDLIELALALEQEFGITIPEAVMGELRTYGDLLAVTEAITRASRRAARAERRTATPRVWARILRQHDQLHRAGWLTPYTAQTIAEDALHAGPGARLDLGVASSVTNASLARLERRFAWLRERGVSVSVHREEPPRRATNALVAVSNPHPRTRNGVTRSDRRQLSLSGDVASGKRSDSDRGRQ